MYFRLDESGGSIAHDSSGNGQDGTYAPGVTYGATGPLVSDPSDTAVTGTSPGAFVTQSGAGLPSGNAARTVEFWWRSGQGNAVPDVVYGQSGSGNHLFEVSLGCGNQCGSNQLTLATGGQSFTWSPLPANWLNGSWHMFDVGYDGKTATAYMDGQVVGSFAVPTALATVTPGDGFSISDADNQGVNDSVAEVAVYPTALTPVGSTRIGPRACRLPGRALPRRATPTATRLWITGRPCTCASVSSLAIPVIGSRLIPPAIARPRRRPMVRTRWVIVPSRPGRWSASQTAR